MPRACKVARTIRADGFMRKEGGGKHGSGEDAIHPFRLHDVRACNAPTQDGADVKHLFLILPRAYKPSSVMMVVPALEEATDR